MKVNIQRAIDFVYKNGNILDKSRIDVILDRKKPAESIIQVIMDLQNEDGGFPYNMQKGKLSSISNTTVALIWLNDLGLLQSDVSKKAIKYIVSMQKEDGSWDENLEIAKYNPPPWMIPGDRKVIVYNTAYSAFWLGVAEYKVSFAFKRAYEFLVKCQSESGRFEGFLHSTWIGTSVFGMVEGWESERVQRGIKFLDSIDSSQWVASQISWLLGCFAQSGIPKDNEFVRKMLEKLSEGQKEDGSFASEDGDEFAVNATIEAVKAMLLWREEI